MKRISNLVLSFTIAMSAFVCVGAVTMVTLCSCSDTSTKSASHSADGGKGKALSYVTRDIEELVEDCASEGDREIVCWGDSMTEGIGAGPALILKDGTAFDASYLSYPEILEELTGVKTFNFGVSGATSEEIAFMQGALTAEDLLYDLDVVDDNVMRRGSMHAGDVLVLEIGSNGGWGENYETLIKQYQEMIVHSGCDDYIIIGDTDDPGTSMADLNQEPFAEGRDTDETSWEAALREAFGDHFINMRAFLVEKGLVTAGLKATAQDEWDAARGCVSEQLRSDWTHLNSFGYYAQATAVYQKGQELGYW